MATRVRLAGEHFGAAVLYLVAGSIGLVWIAPDLAAGNYLAPHVGGVTHLFTLGWLTMTIFGALYQLLPVALSAPIRWHGLGHASFWTFAPGVGLFACGVADNSKMLHDVGVGLVGVGVVLFIVNIAFTLPRAKSRDVTWAAIAIAITYLASTLTLGLVLLHNIDTGFIASARVRVLATHLHVAIVGWALITIVGVGHRLLPMFLLSHGAKTRWTRRALVFLASGVPLLAVGIDTRFAWVGWVGALLMEAGLACFVRQAAAFHRARVRKKIDVGMRFAAAGVSFLIVAAVLGPLVLWRGPAAARLATTYVLVGLLGGIVLFVSGFFYKIVPMLSWTARYGGRARGASVPTIAQLFSARVAELQLATMVGAVLVLATGILAGWSVVTRAGAVLFTVGVLSFANQIWRVAMGGPRGGAAS